MIILTSTSCNNNKDVQKSAATKSITVVENIEQQYKLIDSFIDKDNILLQTYVVQANASTWITAKKGLKVFIDPKKLCKEDGSIISGKIKVMVKEVTNTEEMVLANTPTQSNGKMLLSGGSYFIEMENNGEKLKLKVGNTLQIQSPNFNKKGMQLFYGEPNNNGMVNWQPTVTNFKESAITSKTFRQEYVTTQIKIKDTIGKRCATLIECMKIHRDSTMDARWAFTIANRDKLTYKQEMAYGLRPIEFPWERYKNGIRRERFNGATCAGGNLMTASSMYLIEDTFPVYREDKKIVASKITKEALLNYYEPIEISTLGWINCDKFNEAPICNNIELFLKSEFKVNYCRVYYNFKKLNSLLAEQIEFTNDIVSVINASTKLPIGENVEVTILAISNGTVLKCKKLFKIESDNKWEFDLKSAT
jgi:hypothetical protein